MIRLLANGIKHCRIYDLSRKEEVLISEGDFAPYDWDRKDFQVPEFVISKGKAVQKFEPALVSVISFWENFLRELYDANSPDRSGTQYSG